MLKGKSRMKAFKNQRLKEADLIPSVLQIAAAMKTTDEMPGSSGSIW